MSINLNGKAADSIFHDGKKIGVIYQGGKLVYQGRYIQKFTGRIWTGEGAAGTTGAGNEPYNISSSDGTHGITVYNSEFKKEYTNERFNKASGVYALLNKHIGKEARITYRGYSGTQLVSGKITRDSNSVLRVAGFTVRDYDRIPGYIQTQVSLAVYITGVGYNYFSVTEAFEFKLTYSTPKISYKLPKARKAGYSYTNVNIKHPNGSVSSYLLTADTGTEVDKLYQRMRITKGQTVDVEIEYVKP